MAERVTLKWTAVNWVTVVLMASVGMCLVGIVVAGYQTLYGGAEADA